ncbi:uncharacterized protein LOC110698364 [Chenopodium quinoa]|uniref:Uncharacterized protein n=1 Tax=Chenopodium quinoa TaxID=63459 RepID=A0A803N737_CHEQI|nr:uncharacterized protein LOC110698364 [Chenopodium quinoa]
MQNTSDKSQVKQDERSNGEGDSRMITIEYLRARLLSERSISKATKERADELAKRVKELEDQLKVVTLRRKRAEKAALDVYSYLDSLGVSDISEVYESDSNEDESQYDSDMDNGDTTKVNKAFGPLETEQNDREPLGLEPESTPSSGRSLSWKGRKDSTRLLDKKGLKSSIRSQTSLAQVNSSPRQRLDKSCRQIKRRESRSTIEEPRHDSSMSNAQDSNAMDCLDRGLDCLDFQSVGSRKSPERFGQRGSGKDKVSCSFETQAREYDAGSSSHEYECSGEMERAHQHQAQLIKCYEAQEKDQREWEEKYGENNDSCEPGSHSDVTEERDENKETVPQLVDVGACHDHKVGTQTNSVGRKLSITHFNSFKLSPDATSGSTEKHKFSEMQPSGSPAPEFAFSATNSNQSLEHAARQSLQAGHDDPSYSGSVSCELQPPWKDDSRSLVPHEEPSYRVKTVLEALHEAKLLIKQQINSFPDTKISVGRIIETSVPANGDVDWLNIPVGCPGLFRVPSAPDCQSLIQSTLPSSNHLSELTISALDTRPLAVQGHQYISCPLGSQLSSPGAESLFSTPDIPNRQPRFDFQFNTNISSGNSNELTSLVFPDFFPHMPSHQMMGSQFPRNNEGILPYGYPSFQNHDVRSNTYRDR